MNLLSLSPYANNAVLRLYPSVPINSRTATKMTTLPTGGGPDGKAPVLVRPGAPVGYCVYVMHRRKDLYGEDADEFRPERWEGDDLKDIGWGYLPFNNGPRVCLGRKLPLRTINRYLLLTITTFAEEFALLLVSYTLARFIQLFPVIQVADGDSGSRIGEERQTLTLVVSCAEGCKVLLKTGE
jgi:cytochrome P450